MDKVIPSAREAVADIPDGALLAVGGFGLVSSTSPKRGVILRELAPDVTADEVHAATEAEMTMG